MENLPTSFINNLILIIVGASFILIGLIVPRFKLYWLIAGLNGLPKKELKKYNLRYIEKYFGLFMIIQGLLVIGDPFFWTWMNHPEYILTTFLIVFFSTIVCMFIFGTIFRKKIYDPIH